MVALSHMSISHVETDDKRKDLGRHVLAMPKRISTKYGLTKKTQLENGIRQRNVLPVTEFGALEDDIEVEIVTEELGIKYGYLILSSVLSTDDISIVSPDIQQLKKMLTIPEFVCNKWQMILNYRKVEY